VDGKERVGGVMQCNQNPPRNGEGDRAQRGGGGAPPLQRPVVYNARKLRREMSLPEVLLWEQLRAAKQGMKFRRQHPVGPYIADFYCSAAKLVIEIDGEAHDRGDRPERDIVRDAAMRNAGYEVLRISAADVLKDMEAVILTIRAAAESPLHRASTVPLPASGEDLL
jgi:very-short-patch-repair endonuclease